MPIVDWNQSTCSSTPPTIELNERKKECQRRRKLTRAVRVSRLPAAGHPLASKPVASFTAGVSYETQSRLVGTDPLLGNSFAENGPSRL